MSQHVNRPAGWLPGASLAVAMLWGSCGLVRAEDPAVSPLRYVGVNSCAAANCHGGDGSGAAWTSSYSDWVQRDPHARAGSTLHGERSRRIVEALGWKQPAHRAVACLNCHALPPRAAGNTSHHENEKLASDGVSCEACHGPASRWMPLHYRQDWVKRRRDMTGRELWSELGFVKTEDMRTRVRVCVGCHVGGPGRDVSHDLVAAGHPRLNFELSVYHANLPRHWDDKADRKRYAGRMAKPDGSLRELKLWAVGQVETLRARAVLSRWRAATPSAPWPELSETRCFACHHDLADARWRREAVLDNNRRSVQFSWAGWERSAVDTLQVLKQVAAGDELLGALGRIDNVTRTIVPTRQAMQEQLIPLIRHLDEWSDRLSAYRFSVSDLDALSRRLVAESRLTPRPTDWDHAAQLYLALSAFHVAHREATDLDDVRRGEVDRVLREALPVMRAALRFPDGHDSAGQLGGPVPGGGRPDALQQFETATKKLRMALMNSGGVE